MFHIGLVFRWKADVTICSVDGRNALDFAVDFGNVECAQMLIRSDTWRESLRNRSVSFYTGVYC